MRGLARANYINRVGSQQSVESSFLFHLDVVPSLLGMRGGGSGVGSSGGSPLLASSGGGRRAPLKFRQTKFRTLPSWTLSFVLFFLLLLFVVAGQWRRLPRYETSSSSSPSGSGYTVLINTWKRNDLLKQSVSHYSSCADVESIHIVWSEPDRPSDSLRESLRQAAQQNSKNCDGVDLKFDLNEADSLNNRFRDIKDLKTDAVFSIDDDVLFPCASMDLAFSVWQSAPAAMVGFVPRMHWLDTEMRNRNREYYYKYGGWWSVWWTGTYSMVLSKAAFFHKKYLDLYTNHMPESIRQYVAKYRNCEDIAMSFLSANATGAPPIWVKGRIFEIGSSGISSSGGHSQRRTHCLNLFAKIYGEMPLVATNMKVVDSKHSWFW